MQVPSPRTTWCWRTTVPLCELARGPSFLPILMTMTVHYAVAILQAMNAFGHKWRVFPFTKMRLLRRAELATDMTMIVLTCAFFIRRRGLPRCVRHEIRAQALTQLLPLPGFCFPGGLWKITVPPARSRTKITPTCAVKDGLGLGRMACASRS